MTPQDGGRFCGDCKKVVRDLSSMTEREAKALLRGTDNAGLCVRYVYDAHGRIIFGGASKTKTELVPATFLSRARRAAVALATVAMPLATQGCGDGLDGPLNATGSQELSARQTDDKPTGEAMGGMSYYEPDAGEAADASPDAAGEVMGDLLPPDAGDEGDASPDASTVEDVDGGAAEESDASTDDGGTPSLD
ncbi:MAG TPA: hypothetical protein VM925_17495 [Labilithrix sp.]|nr:hypothetical protein [Labilithrix sp.]